jgi:hypothetical protein
VRDHPGYGMSNLRRGHYELADDVPPHSRLAAVFPI